MEVTSSSKTMVPVYQSICCHIPKDSGRLTAVRTSVLLRYIFGQRKGKMTDKKYHQTENAKAIHLGNETHMGHISKNKKYFSL